MGTKQLKQQKNPLEIVADRLAEEAIVVCFDEFFVTDIGDAMILNQGDSVSYGHAIGGETSISVAFWMKPSDAFASDGTGLVRKYSGNSSDFQGGWSFQLRSEAEMRYRCSSGWDNGAGDLKVTDSFPVNTWTHIVGTYDGATDTWLMTGKFWPTLYRVRFVPR